jgi:DNA-binding MarR family transcriptional regulator
MMSEKIRPHHLERKAILGRLIPRRCPIADELRDRKPFEEFYGITDGQNHLGRSIALDSASIVGVVSRLKARKLISVSKDKEDRRRIVIDLTASGRIIIAKAIQKGSLANELTLAPLTNEQRKTLIGLLSQIAPSEDISK